MSKDQPSRYGANQIAEIANGIVDPVLARRAGINTALLGSWEDIVGEGFADCTRPEKIAWPRRSDLPEDGGHRPGVLTIACEGARALFLSHAQGELIARINGFFGYPAIGQVRIVQKPVSVTSTRPRIRKLEGRKGAATGGDDGRHRKREPPSRGRTSRHGRSAGAPQIGLRLTPAP